MNWQRGYFIFLLTFPLLSLSLRAQREQIFVGTRPNSLGEAFVAVADDGHAVYWNPAGLARLNNIQLTFNYADLYGLGLKSYYTSFTSRLYFIPGLSDYLTVGLDAFGMNIGDDGLDFGRNQYNLAFGLNPHRKWPVVNNFNLGFNLKYIGLDASLDNQKEVDAKGFGVDVGLLYHLKWHMLPGRLDLGLMFQDINGTYIKHDNGVKENILPQNNRIGLCYRPFDGLDRGNTLLSDALIAVDLSDRIHIGIECWLRNTLAFRAGIQKDIRCKKFGKMHFGNEPATLSFGLAVKMAPRTQGLAKINADFGYVYPPSLGATHHWGGSLIFYEDPRLVRIEEAFIDNLFASHYLHYRQENAIIGTVKIKNVNTEDTLYTDIHFKTNRFMDNPTRIGDTFQLLPGQDSTISLRASFNKDFIELSNEESVQGEIIIDYEYSDEPFQTRRYVDFSVHDRNRITWDDVRHVGSFLTKDDNNIIDFTDAILKQKRQEQCPSFLSDNIKDAICLYEALSRLGFQWIQDPSLTGQVDQDSVKKDSLREQDILKNVIDRVDYPMELLASEARLGECDDLSVLYATLLESKSIETAFLDVPGHVFVMFNTDIPAQRLSSLPLERNLFVVHQGNLWIPVELTVLPRSFTTAWYNGAEEFYNYAHTNQLDIVNTRDAVQLFPPSPYNPDVDRGKISTLPDFSAHINNTFATISHDADSYMTEIVNNFTHNSTDFDARNQYAVILAHEENYDSARYHLEYILDRNPNYVKAMNNLGNIEFLEGHLDQAIDNYNRANQVNMTAGTSINLSFLYEMQQIDSANTEFYQRQKDASLEQAKLLISQNAITDHNEHVNYLLGLPSSLPFGKAQQLTGVVEEPDTTKEIQQESATEKPVDLKSEREKSWRERLWDRSPTFVKNALRSLRDGPPQKAEILEAALGKKKRYVQSNKADILWWSI